MTMGAVTGFRGSRGVVDQVLDQKAVLQQSEEEDVSCTTPASLRAPASGMERHRTSRRS